jgi:superfamily I DNA and RNA helicase
LSLTDRPVIARSSFDGELPNFYTYTNDTELLRKTEAAVTKLVKRGIALVDIAIICWRGLAGSQIVKAQQLGNYVLRCPTGKYSTAGDAIWTEGNLLVDSVYRFKGQSAAGIVLTEVDFESIDDSVRRKLFVGLTRAQLAVEIVLTEKAASALYAIN